MAAYAALVSLSQILHQILHPPPLHVFIFDVEPIEFLRGKVDFLIDFFETNPSRNNDEIGDLQMQIADAAYAAEDIIESNMVEQIRATDGENLYILSCEGIQTVIEKFIFLEKECIKIRVLHGVADLQFRFSKIATSTRSVPGGKIDMVGFDKHVNEILGGLASDESNRRIIAIVGMCGIGKTTLATAVYKNPYIVEYFYVRAWVTVSQDYTVRDLLVCLLSEIIRVDPDEGKSTDDELGLRLYKELYGRRYLIVMDDMWNIQAWEDVKMFFPENKNGSRILVTSRISNLALGFKSCALYKMCFLDDGQSWDLLRRKVFVEEDCPVELEETGQSIAKRCCGLPLALVLIGGLLAKSNRTIEHWRSVEEDVTSALNYENSEQLAKILSLSYIHLPEYLKPCFLYLAVFPEDFNIRVSRLVRLWVAEGFIKPTPAKCLEELAHEYLEDLIGRNLISVHNMRHSGKVKYCKIHDLLRDLCIVQAEKEKFVCVTKVDRSNVSPYIGAKRRLTIFSPSKTVDRTTIEALQSAKLNRSWVNLSRPHWKDAFIVEKPSKKLEVNQIINVFKLLKVVHDRDARIDILNFSNLRYVATDSVSSLCRMSLCWKNLQTLEVSKDVVLVDEIWQMPLIRHLLVNEIYLTDPPPDDQNVIVLENLQTLKTIRNFECTDHVTKRIPNLRVLRISYSSGSLAVGNHCLHNLVNFKKLESLGIRSNEKLSMDIVFPISLKKLALENCKIHWKDLSIVGSLPNLEALKLSYNATVGQEWDPIEGGFCRLKFLFIRWSELKIWRAENYHFPSLERLVLRNMMLKEIPLSFSEILTLQVVELESVMDSVRISAREISDERLQLGYEPLQIRDYDRMNKWR